MRFIIFIFPFLVLLAIGYMIPLLKVEVAPLPANILLTYDRTGGPANFNDHLVIYTNGEVHGNGAYTGTLPHNTLQDLISFLESNRYSSMVESLRDRQENRKPVPDPAPLRSVTIVNAISGTIQIAPDTFIRNLLQPYISSTL
ncbi:MAG: hypothetical protein AAB381_00105 [Patescibacteria group bacterium]